MKRRTNHNFQNERTLLNIVSGGAGFTLIELLVVMAILGILSTVGLTSFRTSQMKGRDAERKHDLEQIQRGMELYYNDYGVYPDSSDFDFGSTWQDAAGTVYMRTVPNDPHGCSYVYEPGLNNASYKLYARLENINDPEVGAYSFDCCDADDCNYGVASPNTSL